MGKAPLGLEQVLAAAIVLLMLVKAWVYLGGLR